MANELTPIERIRKTQEESRYEKSNVPTVIATIETLVKEEPTTYSTHYYNLNDWEVASLRELGFSVEPQTVERWDDGDAETKHVISW